MSEEPAEQLPPYRLEPARSGRSSCKGCRRKIAMGDVRLGVLIEGPFGSGYLWYHLHCAARSRFEQLEAAYKERCFPEGLELPDLEELSRIHAQSAERKEAKKALPYAEVAPSGRSKCRHCGSTIQQGALRVALPRKVEFYGQQRVASILVHTACASAALSDEDSLVEPGQLAQELRTNSRGLAEDELERALSEIGAVD
jgi:hypothetical protein